MGGGKGKREAVGVGKVVISVMVVVVLLGCHGKMSVVERVKTTRVEMERGR